MKIPHTHTKKKNGDDKNPDPKLEKKHTQNKANTEHEKFKKYIPKTEIKKVIPKIIIKKQKTNPKQNKIQKEDHHTQNGKTENPIPKT